MQRFLSTSRQSYHHWKHILNFDMQWLPLPFLNAHYAIVVNWLESCSVSCPTESLQKLDELTLDMSLVVNIIYLGHHRQAETN